MRGLEMQGVCAAVGGFAVRYELSVAAGDCTALIGPSGAGKSTLLSLVAGFEHVNSGRILFNGAEIQDLAPERRPVASLFQEHNLFPHLTVFENVGLGIDPGLRLNGAGRDAVHAALARVGLAGKEKRRPGALSGGERQRAALARALVRERPLLLLDEPFAALGPALRHAMLDLLDSIRREHGRSVLLVSHHPEDARRIAERTAFVQDGQIRAEGPTEDLLVRAVPPEVVAYLGTGSSPGP